MNQKFPKPMTPFDSLVTPHHLYLMKLLLPYVPPAFQRMLACYIKFMEFQYTLEHFQGFSSSSDETSHILNDLKPYMDPGEQEMMEQMESMMNMMEMVQGMQEMASSMPDSDSDNTASPGFDPMEMLKSMLSPDS